MPLRLSRENIADRLRDYSRDNYLFLGNVIKGVALATATIGGLGIFSDLNHYWPRVAPWAASLLAIIVSYMTWGRGVLMTNSRSNLWDSILPLLMGLFEFSMFGILLPNEQHPMLWHFWFLVFGLHSLFAVFLVTNRISNIIIKDDFDSSLWELAESFVAWLQKDRIGAGVACGASFVSFIVLNALVWRRFNQFNADLVQTILASVSGGFLIFPIHNADKQRREIDTFISKADGLT